MKPWLPLLLLASCAPPDTPETSSWVAGLSLKENLIGSGSEGLPTLTPEQFNEYQAWSGTSILGGEIARRPNRKLIELSALLRTSFLLQLVESRQVNLPTKQWAYGWWAKAPHDAGLPRMVLRLRYEKDPTSVILLSQGLLLLKNASGLDAIHHLLADENLANQTRQLAKDSLSYLPNHPGDGASFAQEWQALNDCRQSWVKTQDFGKINSSAEFEAEFWKMAQRFKSQPLRPVDEARFVFRRLGPPAFGLLMKAAKDPNRYVREHTLQTMAWIGEPLGRWLLPQAPFWRAFFKNALRDTLTRTRALAALGGTGMAEASLLIFPYLENGNREVQTAAADALLRSCPENHFQRLNMFLALESRISPEARFSLSLLLQTRPKAPSELDPAEIERRRRWRTQRWSP